MIRLLIAAGASVTASLLMTRLLIDFLTRIQVGQPIREDGPQGHTFKAGTPTMGGLAIVAGAFVGYIAGDVTALFGVRSAPTFTSRGLIVMATIAATGAVGFLDDWIKVSRERNLGLNKRAKVIGLVSVAIAFAVATVTLTSHQTTLGLLRFDNPGLELGRIGWSLWAILLILATANAVNLTDGLDGLASGAAILNFAGYTFVAFWAFRHSDAYDIPAALDLAVVSVSMLGGCVGFLWYNAAPAQIFMGDTGSLAIGAALATLALTLHTQLLLPVMGALFVAETVSVILQVTVFKMRDGKRLFRMAPIHHHFELAGWPETRVIIRFWLLTGLTTGMGVGLFYWDSIAQGIAK